MLFMLPPAYRRRWDAGNIDGRETNVFPLPLAIDWVSLGRNVSLRFGDFDLEGGTRRLLRRGAEVHLSPKAFALLTALLERRPNAVSKRDLQDILWPSTFVAESNLPALVNELRSALGDQTARPRFIRTVPRFGYAFCGDAMERQASPATDAEAGLSCWLIMETSRIQLSEGEHVIGRDTLADVWIDLPTMSRRHARIVITGDEARLEDLGSKNGTSLGGQPISAPRVLRDRDVILFGSVQVVFRAWQARSDVETQTADSPAAQAPTITRTSS
jgi:DNA-binding winged helix-turn-helix (wHTH) protein